MIKTFMPGSNEPCDAEEYCPHCDSCIGIIADMGEYETTCPVCGNKLMLCTYCHDDFGDHCDWDEDSDSCSRSCRPDINILQVQHHSDSHFSTTCSENGNNYDRLRKEMLAAGVSDYDVELAISVIRKMKGERL